MRLRDDNQLTQPKLAKRVLFLQAILTLAVTVAAAAFGLVPALSVFIGGLACLVANAAVALVIFRDYQASQPAQLLSRLYAAEVLRILLLIGSFAAAFLTIDGLSLPALLGGYFLVQVLAPMIAAQTAPNARHQPGPRAANGPGAPRETSDQATS
ncbi:MAG: ATP synthase subunit I [Desulfobacterales bacterium]|jgi:ATP synthase protein I|nr:ATP synthase subunit I [Desulfobacterales bacterium]